MRERRNHPRYDVSIPVDVTLRDAIGDAQSFSVHTMNVCREGVAVAFYEEDESIWLFPYVLSQNQSINLVLELPPSGEKIKAHGNVRWHDSGTQGHRRYFRAGVYLKEMLPADQARWEQFVEKLAPTVQADAAGA
jgi:hypothetical protein